jgi:hypothetical protein
MTSCVFCIAYLNCASFHAEKTNCLQVLTGMDVGESVRVWRFSAGVHTETAATTLTKLAAAAPRQTATGVRVNATLFVNASRTLERCELFFAKGVISQAAPMSVAPNGWWITVPDRAQLVTVLCNGGAASTWPLPAGF